MSLAVSIVSYNTKDLLRDCLNNLLSEDSRGKINIWVLDNNSEDGSAEMVEKKFPNVNLIKSGKNLGFAKGQNEILKKVKDEFVLVLNPDTEFESQVLEKIVKFADESDCDVAGIKLTDFKGNLEANGGDFPFGIALFSWLFNLEFLGNLPSFHRLDKKYYDGIHEVDWISGTFMLVRTDVFKKAGLLNDDFFMYFEDVEFCYRVKKSGGKIFINPEIVVKHKSGSSSKNPEFAQWKGEFEGLIKFHNKHTGILGGVFVRFLIYLAILLRILAFALTGNFEKSATYAKVIVSI